MLSRIRLPLLLLILAGVVAEAIYLSMDEHPEGISVSIIQRHQVPAHSSANEELTKDTPDVEEEAGSIEVVDIFSIQTWAPPAPAVKPLPPPPPQAPPLPYRYMGQINEAMDRTFILVRGDQIHTVRVGDILDDTYVVEKFDHGQLHFLYRPMNTRQSLFVGLDS